MNKIAVVMTTVALSIGLFGGAAFAGSPATLPADPLGGAMGDAEGSIQNWVLTIGVPTLVTLTVLGILIRVGLKWLRRAGSRV